MGSLSEIPTGIYKDSRMASYTGSYEGFYVGSHVGFFNRECIKKINWSYAHRVSQRIYAHRTCYRFSKSPRHTARARIRTKRCIPVDIQYHSGDRTALLNRIYLLDVSYGCIRYISVVLIVSCVLLFVVSQQRLYFFFRVHVFKHTAFKLNGKFSKYTDIHNDSKEILS